jgi:hypothetical protein
MENLYTIDCSDGSRRIADGQVRRDLGGDSQWEQDRIHGF